VGVQQEILRCHTDLYVPHGSGFPVVAVHGGSVEIGSLVDAPFGVAFEPDLSEFSPLAEWSF
jgi:hypothetical protein